MMVTIPLTWSHVIQVSRLTHTHFASDVSLMITWHLLIETQVGDRNSITETSYAGVSPTGEDTQTSNGKLIVTLWQEMIGNDFF